MSIILKYNQYLEYYLGLHWFRHATNILIQKWYQKNIMYEKVNSWYRKKTHINQIHFYKLDDLDIAV